MYANVTNLNSVCQGKGSLLNLTNSPDGFRVSTLTALSLKVEFPACR